MMTSSADQVPTFADLPPEYCDRARARVAIVPVPYDTTSTWKKGADRGPAAILEASHALELYDIETGTEPFRHGIATLDPVACGADPERLAKEVKAVVGSLLEAGALPVLLGGEHSISIGAIQAAAASCPGLSVLQIDAHADTREQYGGSAYNHACVMARARELCSVVQVGIRSMDHGEVGAISPDRVFYAHQIMAEHGRGHDWMDLAISRLSDDVYVTIDLDAFDPSIMPATGTPEPGGLDWYTVNALLAKVAVRRRVIGFDVVELLPTPEAWACDFLAAKLIYRFLSEVLADHQPST